MVESQGELSTLSDDSIDERSFEEQLAYGVPDPREFNAANILPVRDHFAQWREQVEPDRSVVLLDTTTVQNAVWCVEQSGVSPDVVRLLDLNTICTAFIFYDRVVFQDAGAIEKMNFGALPVKGLQYRRKFADEHLKKFWLAGIGLLNEINMQAVWRSFFAGTRLENMISDARHNDYYNSGQPFTGDPLPMWVDLTGPEIWSTVIRNNKGIGSSERISERILQRIADDFIVQSHRAAFNDCLSGALGISYLGTALRGPIQQRLLALRSKFSGDCTPTVERVVEALAPGCSSMLLPLPLTIVLAQVKRLRDAGDDSPLHDVIWKSVTKIRDSAWPFRQLLNEIEQLSFDKQYESIDKLSRELREKGGLADALKSMTAGIIDLGLKAIGATPIAGLTVYIFKAGRASGYLGKILDGASKSMSPRVRERARQAKDWLSQNMGQKYYFPSRLQKTAQAFASNGNLALIRDVWGTPIQQEQLTWCRLLQSPESLPPDFVPNTRVR